MTSVVADTIDIIKEKCPIPVEKIRVDDLVIGIFFTGVKLSTGQAGVAFTPHGEIPEAVCCPTSAARMPEAGNIENKSLSEILNDSLDPNVLKSAIGIAALNALSQLIVESEQGIRFPVTKDTDGFDILEIQPTETVSLVGAFGPYIRRLKMMGNPFFIVERSMQTLRPDEMRYYKPESEMSFALKKSNVVIVTGTAIVNHSIDTILSVVGNSKRTAIIGPTASMIPDAFFERSVNVIAGIRIVEPDLMIKILKQGGSAYHLLKQCSEKIAFTTI